MDLDSLYSKALTGDTSAEKRLFEILSVRFGLVARSRIRNDLDADEAVQNALTVIFSEYKTAVPRSSFGAWAYTVLNNRILSVLQTRKRRADRTDILTPSQETQAMVADDTDPDLIQQLLSCLQSISQGNIRYARILNLHYQGYNTREICDKLDITDNHMYVLLSRARSAMQECLDQAGVI
ncbi:MAG: RNA polymerase sigma factor [Candidatus Zixiibacteriota bacterium]|nr:MAG: RNA polymerase sigma factor [candidate division Zixibacteria bacterium]